MKTSLLETLLPIRHNASSLPAAFDPSTQQSACGSPGVIRSITRSDDGPKAFDIKITDVGGPI